jgi:hypothetical protein
MHVPVVGKRRMEILGSSVILRAGLSGRESQCNPPAAVAVEARLFGGLQAEETDDGCVCVCVGDILVMPWAEWL